MIDLKDAVHELRSQVLLDLDSSDFRWPNAHVVRAANTTIQEMLRKRPILLFRQTNKYVSNEEYLLDADVLENDGTAEIELPARYREALIHGMAARCYEGDANNQTDAARMAYEKARFDELMAQ